MEQFDSTVSKDTRFEHILSDPRFKRVPKHERKIRIDSRFKGMFTDKKFKMKYIVDKRGRKVEESSNENLSKYYDLSDENEETKDEGDNQDSHELEELNVTSDIRKKEKKRKKEEKVDVQEPPEEEDLEVKEEEDKGYSASEEENDGDDEENDDDDNEEKDDDDDEEEESCDGETNDDEDEEEIDDEEKRNNVEEEENDDDSKEEIADEEVVSDGSASSSDTDAEMPFRSDEPEIIHDWGEWNNDCPTGEEATHRLAACKMDWDRIKAQDLLVVFSSFKPQGGTVESVTVYLSDLGVERLSYEEVHGPYLKLPKPKPGSTATSLSGPSTFNPDEEDPAFVEALRQYQLERLDYHYAVVVCDSAATAEHIYQQCDGTEYESSATCFDLRFIPDDMSFDDRSTIGTADGSMPLSSYTPTTFINSALQQTSVRLTWDEPDRTRLACTKQKYTKETVLEADLKDYVAPCSASDSEGNSGEDENRNLNLLTDESRLEIYKKLLSEGKKESESDEDVDMEISWGNGLKEVTEKITSGKAGTEGTTWENYLEGRNKKRKARRRIEKEADEELSEEESTEEELHEEPSKEGELELVMMDSEDEEGKEHFSLKGILKEEKNKKSRKRRKLKEKQADKIQSDSFKMDLNDDRFGAIYNSAEYALDPSDPHYKPTKGMASLIRERQSRQQKKQDRQERETMKRQEGEGGKRMKHSSKKTLAEEDKSRNHFLEEKDSHESDDAVSSPKRLKTSKSKELQQLVNSVKIKAEGRLQSKKKKKSKPHYAT